MTIKPVLVPDHTANDLRRLMDHFAEASTGPTRQQLTESRSAVAAAQGVTEARNTYTVVFVDPSVGPEQIGTFDNAAEAKQLIKNSYREMYDTGDHLRNVAPGIYVLEEDYRNTGEQATADNYKHMYHWIIQKSSGITEGSDTISEGIMDVVKQTFNDCVAGYPQGTSEGQFLQGWARAIRAETGRDVPAEKLAKLYQDYTERSPEIMQSHGTTNEGSAEDNLNELDKSTLGSYVKKAAADVNTKSRDAQQHKDMWAGNYPVRGAKKQARQNQADIDKRVGGISRAVDRLSAEDVAEGEGMSRAAKGYEKYGREGMAALAAAGREGRDLDKIRDRYDRYDEGVEEGAGEMPVNKYIAQELDTLLKLAQDQVDDITNRSRDGYGNKKSGGLEDAIFELSGVSNGFHSSMAEGVAELQELNSGLPRIGNWIIRNLKKVGNRIDLPQLIKQETSNQQVDELSNSTLGSYLQKSQGDAARYDQAGDVARHEKGDAELANKMYQKGDNRYHGEKRAERRLKSVDEAGQPDVMRHKGDTTIKVVKRAGKPIGEIGIDSEASPGNGQYYVKLYDGSYDAVGFDTAEEALAELRAAISEGITETADGVKYGVFAKGGSVGSQRFRDDPLKTFDSREEAVADARRRRSGLSKGERGYYRMGYVVKPIKGEVDEGMIDNIKNTVRAANYDRLARRSNSQAVAGGGFAPPAQFKSLSAKGDQRAQKAQDIRKDDVEEGWKQIAGAGALAAATALGGYAAGSNNSSKGFSNTKGIDQFNKPTAAYVQPLRTQADLDAYNKTRPAGTSKLLNLPKDFEEGIAEDDVDDFVSGGGKITQVKPNKGPRRSGVSLGSKHIGTVRGGKASSISGKRANTHSTVKPVVAVEQQVDEIDMGLVGDAVAGAALGLGSVGVGSYIGHKIGNKIGQKFIDRSNRKEAERQAKEKQDRNQQVDEKSEAVRHGNNSRSIYHVDESVDPIEQLRADIKRFAQ